MDHAEAADRLEAVLIEENAALERSDPAAIGPLLERKLAAANALSLEKISIIQAHRLRVLAADNRRLIEGAMHVQGQIIAMVLRAAQSTPRHARYGAEGRALAGTQAPAVLRQA